MSPTVFKPLLLTLLGTVLSGCGLYQSVSDTSGSIARSVFYKQVKTLHLDFTGRAAMNTDSRDMSALSVPTLVRIYQLRDGKSFAAASYESLLTDGSAALGSDLLDERAVVVKPDEGAQLNVAMDKAAQMVAVVALFRQPDTAKDSWRLMLARGELDPDKARVIELGDNRLSLRPLPRQE